MYQRIPKTSWSTTPSMTIILEDRKVMSFLCMSIFDCHLSSHCVLQNRVKDILSEMTSQIPEVVHIRHCMLFEFCKGNTATIATKGGFLSSNPVILTC
ncbi:uncharacterized protein [Onthophagus taurus]|uniref:uncharacterized protein n=1 Tax=Onthophagus taurus TaxID=166361 RepID=UPI0039BE3B9C